MPRLRKPRGVGGRFAVVHEGVNLGQFPDLIQYPCTYQVKTKEEKEVLMVGPVPTVDEEDLKKAYDLRCEFGSASIDVTVFQKICKPEADAFAVGYRSSLLILLAQMGQTISDGFIAAFAKTPL